MRIFFRKRYLIQISKKGTHPFHIQLVSFKIGYAMFDMQKGMRRRQPTSCADYANVGFFPLLRSNFLTKTRSFLFLTDCAQVVIHLWDGLRYNKEMKELHHKGRGAVSNREGRFEPTHSEIFDDGWGTLEREEPPPLRTEVHKDTLRSLITRNNSPDIPFEQSINPYRGCEHGCIYCYARPTHTYLGHSAGLDFETQIYAKDGAGAVLDKELRKRRYVVKPITLGANTDPYQPLERRLGITREILQTLHDFQHPVYIITKGAAILRDLDLLGPMAEKGLVRVMVSVTTLQHELANKLEPRAAAPKRRVEIIKRLTDAGIPVTVNAAPMIPALNDMELEHIMEAAQQAGADRAIYILLRLPMEVRDLFYEWLHVHYPDRASHVQSLIRQTQNGSDYNATRGVRFRGQGPYAKLLKQRYHVTCRRLGFDTARRELNTALFCPPPRIGDQLSLFSPKVLS